jgi:hypothetical protein
MMHLLNVSVNKNKKNDIFLKYNTVLEKADVNYMPSCPGRQMGGFRGGEKAVEKIDKYIIYIDNIFYFIFTSLTPFFFPTRGFFSRFVMYLCFFFTGVTGVRFA